MSSGNPLALPEASTSSIPLPEASTSSIQPHQTLEDSASASSIGYRPISHVAIDFFIRKKRQDLKLGKLTITDSSDNVVFRVDGKSSKSTPRPRRLLLDDSGNPIFAIFPYDGGWQVFRGESGEWKDLVFRVQRTYSSLLITELEVFLLDENWGDSTSDFKVKGCPFQRSCTIYKRNAIVAEVMRNESYVQAEEDYCGEAQI